MARPSKVGSATKIGLTTAVGGTTIPYPSSLVTGNYVVLTFVLDDPNKAVTATGFTAPTGGGVVSDSGADTGRQFGRLYRKIDGSEGANISIAWSGTAACSAIAQQWQNVATSGAMPQSAGGLEAASEDPYTFAANQITSVGANSVILFGFGEDSKQRTVSTKDASLTLVDSDVSGTSSDHTLYEYYEATPGSGNVGYSNDMNSAARWLGMVSELVGTSGGASLTGIAAAGVATVSALFTKKRLVSTAAPAGTSTAAATLNARRQITAAVSGVGTPVISLNARRPVTAAPAGTSTAACGVRARRAVSLLAAGIAAVTVNLGAIRAVSASVPGTSTVSVSLGKRSGNSLQASPAGTSTVSVSLKALRAVTASAAGTSSATASLSARRAISASPAGAGSAAVSFNVARTVYPTAAGSASVSVTLGNNRAPAAAATGKYAAEHALAYQMISDAEQFAAEHADALRMIGDAGV